MIFIKIIAVAVNDTATVKADVIFEGDILIIH